MIDHTGDDNWMQMYSGIRFWPLSPDIENILLPDIAHALAFQCRFGGHTRQFYSVGQHCILTAQLSEIDFPSTPNIQLAALLHDATEAYLVDLPRPIKRQMPIYKQTEDKLASLIAKKFGLIPSDFERIKKYDEQALSIEANSLMAPLHPDWFTTSMQDMQLPLGINITKYLNPEEAESEYMKMFNTFWMSLK